DAELDLRIIRGEEAPARLGDEGRADATPELRADGNVLQIWSARAEPTRRRHELIEGGVDAARRRMDQARQSVAVRRLELGERAVLDDLGGQLVAEGELLEDVGVGRIARLGLLDRRQLELFEKHLGELLGRADVELAAGQRVDLARQRRERAVKLL